MLNLKRIKGQRGFTLVEVIVVAIIVAALPAWRSRCTTIT